MEEEDSLTVAQRRALFEQQPIAKPVAVVPGKVSSRVRAFERISPQPASHSSQPTKNQLSKTEMSSPVYKESGDKSEMTFPPKGAKQESNKDLWMKSPLPFIQTHEDGKMWVNEDVKPYLEKCAAVSTIAVIGKYRTGKSYIMNRFFDSNDGFHLGATVEAKTKGIWIWIRQHPVYKDLTLVLLDIEGLADVKKKQQANDMQLFSLAILLSKVMVYNVMKVIDSSMIQDLNLVTELTKHMKVDSSTSKEKGSEFKLHFPLLVFLLRDFDLLLEKGGDSEITSNDYMEDALECADAFDDEAEAFNRPRKCIKNFFVKRRCYTLCRPVDDLKLLGKLDELSDDQIKPDFLKEASEAVEGILKEAVQLNVKEFKCDGRAFWSLANVYVEMMNKKEIPCISNAADLLKQAELQKAFDNAIAEYERQMQIPMPVSHEEVELQHEQAHMEALQIYQEQTFFSDKKMGENLLDCLEQKYQAINAENYKKSEEKCKQVLKDCFSLLNSKYKDGSYTCKDSYKVYKNDKDKAIQSYHCVQNKGPMGDQMLNTYLENKQNEEWGIIQLDKAMDESEKNIIVERQKVMLEEYKRKEAEQEKQKLIEAGQRRDKEHGQMINDFEAKLRENIEQNEKQHQYHQSKVRQMQHEVDRRKTMGKEVDDLKDVVRNMEKVIREKDEALRQEMSKKHEELLQAKNTRQNQKHGTDFDGVLEQPCDLTTQDVGTSYIGISWEAPKENSEYVDCYEIIYQNDYDGIALKACTKRNDFKLISLWSGTNYTVTVTAIAGAQRSPPSQSIQTKTQSKLAIAVSNTFSALKFW